MTQANEVDTTDLTNINQSNRPPDTRVLQFDNFANEQHLQLN